MQLCPPPPASLRPPTFAPFPGGHPGAPGAIPPYRQSWACLAANVLQPCPSDPRLTTDWCTSLKTQLPRLEGTFSQAGASEETACTQIFFSGPHFQNQPKIHAEICPPVPPHRAWDHLTLPCNRTFPYLSKHLQLIGSHVPKERPVPPSQGYTASL